MLNFQLIGAEIYPNEHFCSYYDTNISNHMFIQLQSNIQVRLSPLRSVQIPDAFFPFAHIREIFIFTVHAGYLYVTDTLSTQSITESLSVECQDLSILCEIECMCGQKRLQFIVPSERLSNEVQVPCLRGLYSDQQKLCFLLSHRIDMPE